jgi:hypothetical protein
MYNRILDYDSPASSASVVRTGNGAKGPASFSFEDVKSYIQPVEELILKYPGAALASAFLVGVVVAWWIKRK